MFRFVFFSSKDDLVIKPSNFLAHCHLLRSWIEHLYFHIGLNIRHGVQHQWEN